MGRLANKIKTEKDIYSAHKYMWTKQDNSNEKRKSSERTAGDGGQEQN